MSQTHFSLKLLAMTLESSYRHLAHNKNIKQNKNLGKMAAKMAVYYKNIRNSPPPTPKTGKLQGFAYKMLILLSLELQTSPL